MNNTKILVASANTPCFTIFEFERAVFIYNQLIDDLLSARFIVYVSIPEFNLKDEIKNLDLCIEVENASRALGECSMLFCGPSTLHVEAKLKGVTSVLMPYKTHWSSVKSDFLYLSNNLHEILDLNRNGLIPSNLKVDDSTKIDGKPMKIWFIFVFDLYSIIRKIFR